MLHTNFTVPLQLLGLYPGFGKYLVTCAQLGTRCGLSTFICPLPYPSKQTRKDTVGKKLNDSRESKSAQHSSPHHIIVQYIQSAQRGASRYNEVYRCRSVPDLRNVHRLSNFVSCGAANSILPLGHG